MGAFITCSIYSRLAIINQEVLMLSRQFPHIVMLPGLANDARLWQHQLAGLTDIAHVWIGDLTTADTITAMATSVLESAPVDKFALAGMSMGGYVALEIMRQAPERILALALLDTSARTDTPTALENRRTAIERAEIDFQAVVNELIAKQIHPSHLEDQFLVGLISDMAMSIGKDTFIRQQKAISNRIDSSPFLPLIKCPTLVICGRDDAITPLGLHQEMVSAIPDAGLVIIDDCGHLSPIEQPTQVNEALSKWLLDVELKA
jgi:pimeloyl-ACP methyl ester carboxylesterase